MTRVGLAILLVVALCATAVASGLRRPVVVLDERVRVSVDVVSAPADRVRGLSGRAGLAPNEGMLFRFERPAIQSFWMKEMRFEIDIVWIQDGRVIGVIERAPLPVPGERPPLLRSPAPCDTVLEIAAGSFGRWGLAIGDAVRFEP
jgi:hypothetical protein